MWLEETSGRTRADSRREREWGGVPGTRARLWHAGRVAPAARQVAEAWNVVRSLVDFFPVLPRVHTRGYKSAGLRPEARKAQGLARERGVHPPKRNDKDSLGCRQATARLPCQGGTNFPDGRRIGFRSNARFLQPSGTSFARLFLVGRFFRLQLEREWTGNGCRQETAWLFREKGGA